MGAEQMVRQLIDDTNRSQFTGSLAQIRLNNQM
jgi:hypothetical protein